MFLEKRNVDKYCSGKDFCEGDNKIEKIVKTISDCDGVISLRIGEEPKKKLKESNIKIFTSCERIEDAITIAGKEIMTDGNKEYAVKS